jgi:hypothetical protein
VAKKPKPDPGVYTYFTDPPEGEPLLCRYSCNQKLRGRYAFLACGYPAVASIELTERDETDADDPGRRFSLPLCRHHLRAFAKDFIDALG